MPSFRPTKNYLARLTQELIERHELRGPFIEVGCGDGMFSILMGRHGWRGIALDVSDDAVRATERAICAEQLADQVCVMQGDIETCSLDRQFQVAIIYDVLEHVANHEAVLQKIRSLLATGGHLLLSVPVRMTEWRWDDEVYGHLRRYEHGQLHSMLRVAGFEILSQWDITFPVLWLARRAYLALRRKPSSVDELSIGCRTQASAFMNAGGRHALVRLAEHLPVWPLVFWLQDRFREKHYGCNTLLLARAV